MALGGAYRPRLGAAASTGGVSWVAHGRRLALVCAVALAAEVVYIVLASPRLAVREVVVRGDPRVVEQVAPRLELGANTGMALAPLGRLRRQAEQAPAVRAARVSRGFPNRLVVTVERREPVAVVRRPEEALLVDPEGVVFVVRDEWGWGLPELVGPSLAEGELESAQARAELSGLLAALRATALELCLGVTRLEYGEGGEITLTLGSGAQARLGRCERLGVKAKLLARVVDTLGLEAIGLVDVSDPEAAYWRPAGGESEAAGGREVSGI